MHRMILRSLTPLSTEEGMSNLAWTAETRAYRVEFLGNIMDVWGTSSVIEKVKLMFTFPAPASLALRTNASRSPHSEDVTLGTTESHHRVHYLSLVPLPIRTMVSVILVCSSNVGPDVSLLNQHTRTQRSL